MSLQGVNSGPALNLDMYPSENNRNTVSQRVNTVFNYAMSSFVGTLLGAVLWSQLGVSVAVFSFMVQSPIAFGLLFTAVGVGLIFAMLNPSIKENTALRNLLYTAFVVTQSLLISPFAALVPTAFIHSAIATSVISLALVMLAYLNPHMVQDYSGEICLSLLGLSALSLASYYFVSLEPLAIIAGLLLFSGLLVYDTQRAITEAKTQKAFDPIQHSLAIYLDMLNIFIRILEVYIKTQQKNQQRA